MSYQWSDHAAHVESLFRPWQPGDGYAEESVRSAEQRLGVPLPGVLRAFYLSWGARDDMTRTTQMLLPPDRLIIRDNAFVFCVEHQSITYWGVRLDMLDQENPPVVIASSGDDESLWTGTARLIWDTAFGHVSDFLDVLTYAHAFDGGALHGGWSTEPPDEQRIDIVKKDWRRVVLNGNPFHFEYDAFDRQWPLYVRDGQVIDWLMRFAVAARDAEALDAIGNELNLSWRNRW